MPRIIDVNSPNGIERWSCSTCEKCGSSDWKYTNLVRLTRTCKYCGTEYELMGTNETSSYGKTDSGSFYMNDLIDTGLAFKYFEEAVNLNPYNFYAWWGMIRAKSKDFTDYSLSSGQVDALKDYLKKAKIGAPPEIDEEMDRVFSEYLGHYTNEFNSRATDLDGQIADLQGRLDKVEAEIKTLTDKGQNIRNQIKTIQTEIDTNNRSFSHKGKFEADVIWYTIGAGVIAGIAYYFWQPFVNYPFVWIRKIAAVITVISGLVCLGGIIYILASIISSIVASNKDSRLTQKNSLLQKRLNEMKTEEQKNNVIISKLTADKNSIISQLSNRKAKRSSL